MLDNLPLFLLVGTLSSVAYFVLEVDRVRWLQGLISEHLPVHEAAHANKRLELYLRTLATGFFFILLLVPFHVDQPVMHYFVAGGALSFTVAAHCVYLTVIGDFGRFAV